jgi:hypothetical protein
VGGLGVWCACTSSFGTGCPYCAYVVEVEVGGEVEMWSEVEVGVGVGSELRPADTEFVDVAAAFAEEGIGVGVDGRIGRGGYLSWYY